ncbi:MAG: AlwI family type II restriction endonuclease [Cycloclasticus sp.]|nr:AlwI family type II restriction endonuclease [Cycloclasticus sp.]
MILWHLGNTTVRSAFRLREGLIALHSSNLQGNLRGKEQELAFCRLLANDNIVAQSGSDATFSVGRKWRSALTKLGFLYPNLTGDLASIQSQIGAPDFITPNGLRLINAENVSGWQECFLRSLASYYIPSVIELRHDCPIFSPLRHVLGILKEIESATGECRLNFIEMALIVQVSSSIDNAQTITQRIIEFREERENSSRKRTFDQNKLTEAGEVFNKAPSTFKDYADTNFRYLKATGLFQSKGKGITLVPSKRVLIDQLISEQVTEKEPVDYISDLCNGARLPIDNQQGAIVVLNDLVDQINSRGDVLNISDRNLSTPADIAIVRHELEDRISELNEIEYAEAQASQVSEIVGYIDMLATKKFSKELDSGEEITIPRGEAPAYFEWTIWRAFLAINSLINHPWESRQFKIDQDFLPVHTASGGRPDMIFEFEHSIIVVEVTLTTSSRQEAAEGEPVRRHVAKYAEEQAENGKQVFGLFLAVNIDTNTANTFRLGEWYLNNDRKIDLHIVPMSLVHFQNLLSKVENQPSELLQHLLNLMRDCRMHATKEAPEWKTKISELSTNLAQTL